MPTIIQWRRQVGKEAGVVSLSTVLRYHPAASVHTGLKGALGCERYVGSVTGRSGRPKPLLDYSGASLVNPTLHHLRDGHPFGVRNLALQMVDTSTVLCFISTNSPRALGLGTTVHSPRALGPGTTVHSH